MSQEVRGCPHPVLGYLVDVHEGCVQLLNRGGSRPVKGAKSFTEPQSILLISCPGLPRMALSTIIGLRDFARYSGWRIKFLFLNCIFICILSCSGPLGQVRLRVPDCHRKHPEREVQPAYRHLSRLPEEGWLGPALDPRRGGHLLREGRCICRRAAIFWLKNRLTYAGLTFSNELTDEVCLEAWFYLFTEIALNVWYKSA